MTLSELPTPVRSYKAVRARPDRTGAVLDLARAVRVAMAPDDAEQLLEDLARLNKPLILSFLNAHSVNLAWRDEAFRHALESADILVRDGTGASILFRMMGREPGLNMNGSDFIPRVLDRFAGRRVALFGTCEPWLGRATEWARARGAEVVASADGFQSESEYLRIAAESRADLILLAMGMPRQESIAPLLAAHLMFPCLIVNGGAILDFWAGRFPRAPRWMRRIGFEWLYRLCLEPERLWRRYVLGNPAFLLRAALVAARARRALD
jgi:exopolysaccharide biosynthesis WecB/TagA/CpsF family protein